MMGFCWEVLLGKRGKQSLGEITSLHLWISLVRDLLRAWNGLAAAHLTIQGTPRSPTPTLRSSPLYPTGQESASVPLCKLIFFLPELPLP